MSVPKAERATPEAEGPARGHVSPRPGGAAPQGSTSARAYTDLEKETIGLRLARMVLASDAEKMIDLRAQHGVGADAMDKLKQFYELKVSAGAEPDRVTLEPSEISLAMSTPDFFLVVVSGVEGVNAQPRVRVIVDPTTQLRMVETSQVRLEGVKNSHSLIRPEAGRTANLGAGGVSVVLGGPQRRSPWSTIAARRAPLTSCALGLGVHRDAAQRAARTYWDDFDAMAATQPINRGLVAGDYEAMPAHRPGSDHRRRPRPVADLAANRTAGPRYQLCGLDVHRSGGAPLQPVRSMSENSRGFAR